MSKQEQGSKFNEIAARCSADEAFKQRLLANPMATLKAEGIELPEDLSDDELNQVVGGNFNDWFRWFWKDILKLPLH
jgi:bacteriocin-like protein